MKLRPLLLLALLLGLSASRAGLQAQSGAVFLVKPYVQLGNAPALAPRESLRLLWQTADGDGIWQVETKPVGSAAWKAAAPPSERRVAVPGIAPHFLREAVLEGLTPGAEFDYRLLKDGRPIFQARARARKASGQPYRFAVFGDCGENTPGQKAVAYQTYLLKPDFVFLPGDIVYPHGSIREYRAEFFPIYNADAPSPQAGAPLLRSTLFLACLGNHDVDGANLGGWSDGLAYFYLWALPLNGPPGSLSATYVPKAGGPDENKRAFLSAASPNYPQMASYSFDYGNAHWTVIDSNPYADWSRPPLRAWLEADLTAAQKATWRFVAFHHPGFSGEGRTFNMARMEAVAALFEKWKVDVVFNGHLHAYLCSRPLRLASGKNKMGGQWSLDLVFDGKTHTKPDGVLYLVTGAGGAHLHQLGVKETFFWQLLTRKVVPGVHSLTAVDVNGKKLTVRQISGAGKELDRFTVTK
jgi:hypothetical protein